MRAAATGPMTFGITLNTATAEPATDSELDREACRRADGMGLRLYLDPLRHGRYPADVVADLDAMGLAIPVQDGDLDVIATPFDVLGVNFYFGQVFAGSDENGRSVDDGGRPVVRAVPRPGPRTAMDWPITPHRFTELLLRLHADHPGLPIVITENGAAFEDVADADGFVRDDLRTGYLAEHIAAMAEARLQGVDVRGYLAWSLLDNFEWAFGYDKRFGIVRVDYDTQQRTPKQSALWLRDVIRRARSR
jgi:beta-glucosidase